MSKEDKKVPFGGLNVTALIATGTGTYRLGAAIPAGKTAFLTRIVVTNLGAAAVAGELHIYDETAQAAVAPTATNTLIAPIRVPYQSTVVVDLGDEGIPVATEIAAAADAVNKFLAQSVQAIGYYL